MTLMKVPQDEDLQNVPINESQVQPSPSKDLDSDSEKCHNMVMQDLETLDPPGPDNFIMDWNCSYNYI